CSMEWLTSVLPASVSYNISVLLSILSCEDDAFSDVEKSSSENVVEISYNEKAEDGIIENIVNFFVNPEPKPVYQQSCIHFEPKSAYFENHCKSLLHVNGNQTISLLYLALSGAILTFLLLLTIIWLLSKVYKSKSDVIENVLEDHQHSVAESEVEQTLSTNSEVSLSDSKKDRHFETLNKNKFDLPLVINIQEVHTQNVENMEHKLSLDNLFEDTVSHFLKELDQNLNTELCLPSESGDGGTSRSASSPYIPAALVSPLLPRRNLHLNANTAGTPGQRRTNESPSKYWIRFQKFRRQMSWVYPDANCDNFKCEQLSQSHNGLSSLIQFLHQRCSVKPRQWSAATAIVDYTLFLLESELTALFLESGGLLTITGFEGTGSVANGTQAGPVDKFQARLGISISSCSEISILHKRFHEVIPSGHVIIGVKCSGNFKQNIKCSRKACIQGVSGFYLLPQQVNEMVEMLIKKAAVRLIREHKSKTDRLPFKIQVSSQKTLVISFDTKLLQGLGLGIGEITLKIIPTLQIFVPQFGILPPLYAVPSQRNVQRNSRNPNSASADFLSRIIRDDGFADLLWEIDTEKLQAVIVQNIERKFMLSGVRGYHKECLMILKALFSKGDENNLLNKGEIDEHILDTVVCFLLQESPPSAWTLHSLTDRISDAVHFLKSAYENRLLPKFLIHNPHLLANITCLQAMTPVLSGHQQNLLTGITNDAATKVLEFIEQRLHETGLFRCMKPEFSSQMWEYEFFVFG
ncbi:unnamed protein product, partial [Candidula unifasciata]